MRSNTFLLLTIVLSIISASVLADRLEVLPPTWHRQLKPVAQVDTSPLKVDVQKAISQTRSKIDIELAASEPDIGLLAAEYGRLGNLYMAHKLRTSADACYGNAMQLAPDYFPWAYYSAYLAQEEGSMQAALVRFQHAIQLEPDYLPARYRLARVYLDLNRLEEAERVFESLIDEPAFEAAAHNGLGEVMALRQQHDQAVEHYSRALALAPEATQIHYPLALSLRAVGETEQAKQHLKLYSRRELVIEDRLVETLQAFRNAANRHFVSAMTAVLKQDYARAVTEFEAGLEHEPYNTDSRISYARALYLAGDRDQARSQLEQIVETTPAESLALFLLALINDETKDSEQATQLYQRVIALDPNHVGANFFLGNHLLKSGDYENAVERYAIVIQQDEKNVPARVFKLVSMLGLGAPDKDLLATAEEIAARAPNFLAITRIQILILALSQDTEVRDGYRAQQLAEQMQKDHPHPVNLELQAITTASAGNFSLATKQMQEAIAQEKRHRENSHSLKRMNDQLSLLENRELPALSWHDEIKHLVPPPTRALTSFRDYPDPKPI